MTVPSALFPCGTVNDQHSPIDCATLPTVPIKGDLRHSHPYRPAASASVTMPTMPHCAADGLGTVCGHSPVPVSETAADGLSAGDFVELAAGPVVRSTAIAALLDWESRGIAIALDPSTPGSVVFCPPVDLVTDRDRELRNRGPGGIDFLWEFDPRTPWQSHAYERDFKRF